ncbi:hypothetical protein BJV74DRAFT_839421, partial [Russula compacta]
MATLVPSIVILFSFAQPVISYFPLSPLLPLLFFCLVTSFAPSPSPIAVSVTFLEVSRRQRGY